MVDYEGQADGSGNAGGTRSPCWQCSECPLPGETASDYAGGCAQGSASARQSHLEWVCPAQLTGNETTRDRWPAAAPEL